MAGINPQTGLIDFNYNAPNTNFLGGNQGVTAEGFGASAVANPAVSVAPTTNFMQTGGFGANAITPNTVIDPNASVGATPFNTGVSADGTPSVGVDTSSSFLSDFSGTDLVNAGLGAASLGLGAYYQNQALDVQEGNLAVSQDALALKQQEYSDRMNASATSAAGAQAEKQRLAASA